MLPCGIRARLLWLVIAAIIPFIVLAGFGLWKEWRTQHEAAMGRALNEARLIAAQVDDHIGNLDNLLLGLSRAVSTNRADAATTRALLRQVKSQLPNFVSHVLLFSPDGHSIATSFENEIGPFYVGDRLYFRKVLDGERLAIGEVIHGRVSGKWLINLARPVEDATGRLLGILAIGTWLEHFQDALRLGRLPADSAVRIVSESGIVIAQSLNAPNWIGRDVSRSEAVLRHMRAQEISEIAPWLDGVERITGSSTAHRVPWLVSVGLPANMAWAAIGASVGWGGLYCTIALLTAFLVAWTLSARIVRPIQQLDQDASMLAAGDLSHRSVIRTRDEIGDLAGSFNLMAASLEQRQDEAKRSADELRRMKDALAALIEHAPIPIVVKELEAQKFILVNRAYEKFMGISRDQLIGRTVNDLFPPDEAERIICYDQRALGSKERITSGEFSVHTPKNGIRIIVTTRLVVHGADNKPQHLMAVIEDVTERKKVEAQIFHLAHHDALTGLPNRTQYNERLEQELKRIERGANLAVLYLDLDHFKNINDTLGHSIGDELLKTAAERLHSCVRETDIIARLGGDEFAIIQTQIEQPSDAAALADRIQEAIRAPLDLDGLHAVTNVSIGISLAPANATASTELMKQADMALYRAKAAGRNTYRFFEPEMDASMRARRRIESSLREALVNGGLELHYQPIVRVADDTIAGVEALLRWRHAERGMLSPAEFIPVAEETGLIIPVGEWVLRQACSEAAKWPGDTKVAVNLSPAQFKDRGLMQVIVSALASSGLDPSRLELEITEELLLQDNENTLARLNQLRELNVQIVMDDFGTGYSSLNYLRRFPLDKIKIDQAFIGGLSEGNAVSLAIVQAVVGIAKVLRVRTTAEGIETEEQLRLVKSIGCTEVQGYLFGSPKPAEQMSRVLADVVERRASAA
jgi:diguanylate cyclase (GGDEF)-like protein/PAS domain S-box-containing protein